MMKSRRLARIICCLIAVGAYSGKGLAQDSLFIFTYPSSKNINVTAGCTVRPVISKYRYEYTVKSSTFSAQKVWVFDVVHQAAVESLRTPNGWDVSIATVPWPYVSWGVNDTVYEILPGGVLNGYNFTSLGLPTIGDFYAEGWIPIPTFPEGVEPDSIVGGTFPEDNFHGITVVPKTPPSPFDSLRFLDTLDSYTTQSRSVGWITDQTTADKYAILFDTARSKLQQNKTREARAELDTVMQQANQDSSTTLTSEAYALIYFNTQYLLSQLPIPPPQYQLTLNSIGSGTVAKNPDQSLYDTATTVQLTASPSTGYFFNGWSGDASGTSNPLSLIMNSNKTITATFTQSTFTISASAGANGGITPSGAVTVNYGNNQSFTITPYSCYHIDSVIVDGVNQGTPSSYTFTNVTADHTIRAVYKINTYTITPTAGSNGTITPSTATTVNCGSNQTFTFTPYSSYHVDSVIVDGVNQGSIPSYTFSSVSSDHTIRVAFAINRYTLSIIISGVGTCGTVTKTPNQATYAAGTSVSLKAKGSIGSSPAYCRFDHWEMDATGTANPITVVMDRNKTVKAVFVAL